MTEITIFENSEFGKIRTTIIDGNPWFVGKDVAYALGYADTAYAIATHCKGVGEMPTPSAGGVQIIN